MARQAVPTSPPRAAVRSTRGKGRVSAVAASTTEDIDQNPLVNNVPLVELASVEDGNAGPRSKRSQILDEAVRQFGRTGYEHTKWSDVAKFVGVGQTALYHYFESKAHCLLSIMRLELARSYQRFLVARAQGGTADEIFMHALTASFDIATPEVLQLRIVLANVDVLTNSRPTEREEAERTACLALTAAIEDSWAQLLGAVMDERGRGGVDAKLMARAVLGLLNSAWRWYRPGGRLSVAELGDFYIAAARRVVA
jgi:TetR/AcrR family transcriptional regulator, cholesterol catabolism regulator